MLAAALAGCGAGGAPSPCAPAAGPLALDAYGGDARLRLRATGWFRAEKSCGRWRLVTPEGHPFYSLGVNSVRPEGDLGRTTNTYAYSAAVDARYPTHEDWADAVTERLWRWGFNTIGAWSTVALFAPRMPYTVILELAADDWLAGSVADYFDPAWKAQATARAQELAAPRAGDPRLLGYFLDNEIRWGPDWRGGETLLQLFLARGPEAPGKAAAVDLLLLELGGVEGVNASLGTHFADRAEMLARTGTWDPLYPGRTRDADRLTTAFLARAAHEYFSTAATAVRAADPHHLVLGNREVATLTRWEVYEAAAPHVDVVSINHYVLNDLVRQVAMALSGAMDPAGFFAALHERMDMPILVTEFGFRARDAGLASDWPPNYPTYATQAERAEAFAAYSKEASARPWVVGHHWYKWVDNPADGRRPDGENNNWGLVNEQDEAYPVLTARMAGVNARAAALEVR